MRSDTPLVPTVGAAEPARLRGVSDALLVEFTRTGDPDAFPELWTRHIDAVVHLTRRLVADPDSVLPVVKDAFAIVKIDIAQDRYAHHHVGVEPFRVSVYRAVADLVGRSLPSGASRPPILRALHQLPPRFQALLWYLDVEAMSLGDVELLVGESPAEMQTAHRLALTNLRAEWLLALLDYPTLPSACVWNLRRTNSRAADWLSKTATQRYDHHLRECRWCQNLAVDLQSPGQALERAMDHSLAAQASPYPVAP